MSRPLGIDARAAAEVPAGRGRYVRELLLALERIPEAADERFVLYAREPWGDLDPARFTWSTIALPDPAWHVAAALRANRQVRAFLSTNSYLTAWFTRVPTTVAVMDLVAFIDGAQAQARAARIERATIRPALRRAASLPCISAATRDDLERLFPASRGKTLVTPLAADPSFSAPSRCPVTLSSAAPTCSPSARWSPGRTSSGCWMPGSCSIRRCVSAMRWRSLGRVGGTTRRSSRRRRRPGLACWGA